MIHKEQIELNGKPYVKTYSDKYFIRKVGTFEIYDEAIDCLDCECEYEETDELRN